MARCYRHAAGITRRGGPVVRERERAIHFSPARSDLGFDLAGLLDGHYANTCNGDAVKTDYVYFVTGVNLKIKTIFCKKKTCVDSWMKFNQKSESIITLETYYIRIFFSSENANFWRPKTGTQKINFIIYWCKMRKKISTWKKKVWSQVFLCTFLSAIKICRGCRGAKW